MSSNFECYVTINDKKQTIVLKKDVNSVTFGDVYKQICKINHNISIESHVFEVFDVIDFSFTRLTDFKSKIKCLSRLRVSPSFKSISSNLHSTNGKLGHDNHSTLGYSDAKRLKTGNQFRDELLRKHSPMFNTAVNQVVSTFNDPYFKPMDQSFREVCPSTEEHPKDNSFSKKFKPITNDSSPKEHPKDNSFSKKFKPIINHSSKNDDKTHVSEESSDSFEWNGMTRNGKQFYCQFCLKFYPSMTEVVKHTSTLEHLKNSREECYETIDKQFLTELKNKKDLKRIFHRKIELNKYNDEEKTNMIKHGIRVMDGFGPQSYVCLTCDRYFDGFSQAKNHFKHYLNVESHNKNNEDYSKSKGSKEKQRKHKDNISDKAKKFKLPEEVADDVKRLVRQGFAVVPISKHKFYLNCRFCEYSAKSVSKAEKHMQTEEHKWLCENPFRGIDRLIVTESTPHNDIEAVLARLDAVNELSCTLKERFLSHGLKVKDGIGSMAYVCNKCNALFERLKDAKNHLKEFEKLKKSLLHRSKTSNNNEDDCLTDSQMEVLEKQMKANDKSFEKMLRNEGIKFKKCDQTLRKQLSSSDDDIPDIYFHCVFCNINFYSKETALYHSNRTFHKKIRRGEYMTPIEAMFCAKTERIDEFDVAFARMEALYRLDNKTKMELRDKGIRLKDGIGSDAYVCLKCNISIPTETIDSALFSLIRHTKSRDHLKYSSH